MCYYIMTIINLLLIVFALYRLVRISFMYHIARRWNNYIIFLITVLIGITLAHIYVLIDSTFGKWQLRVVSTVIILSIIFFAECIKYSSIRKK